MTDIPATSNLAVPVLHAGLQDVILCHHMASHHHVLLQFWPISDCARVTGSRIIMARSQ